MRKTIIIHILKECNLACNLCYACSPKRLNPIKNEEVENLIKTGFLISPEQLSKTIYQIPKKYDIFLRGGEVSLYPNWDSLFLSFAKSGHKIIVDTNGQWVPKNEAKITNRFFEILKNLKHKNITIYFSCDKWHEERDPFLKDRAKIFIRYAERYGLNFFIFSTGLKKYGLKKYYQDLNLDFKRVRFNPNIYKLGRRINDENAVDYCNFKENEILVIDSNGDTYPCLQSYSEKNSIFKLGNIGDSSIEELIGKSLQLDYDSCLNKRAWKSIIPAEDLDKHMVAIEQVQANAKILQQMLINFLIKPKTKILVPGCGTGQIFDYLDISFFKDAYLTFSDINKKYLNKLYQRLKKFKKINYKIIEDDIEATKIQGQFDSCIIILVLEHVNFKKALRNIFNFGVKSVYLIIQKQDKNKQIITSYENIPGSIIKFSTVAKSHIVDESELKQYFKKEGFNLLKRYNEKVINNTEMVGIYFSKK